MYVSRVETSNNTILNSRTNSPAFKSLLYNPKSFLHRINPVVRFMDDYFQRSLYVSRRAWHNIDGELKPFIKEVKQPVSGVNKNITLWDINNGNRDKYAVIMHGLSHNITCLQTLYKEILSKTDYAVLAAEYRSYEHGNKEFMYHSPKEISQDSEAALKYLNDKGINNNNIVVIGHSFGGYAAAKLASKHKDLRGLILASSTNTYKHRVNAIAYGKKKNIPEGIRKLFMNSRLLRFPLSVIFNTGKILKKVIVPTDIIHSKSDQLISFQTSQNLAKLTKNQNSFSVINGSHKMDENKIKKIIELLNLK